MKKIEIMNKVEELADKVALLIDNIDVDAESFIKLMKNYDFEEYRYSYNFRFAMTDVWS